MKVGREPIQVVSGPDEPVTVSAAGQRLTLSPVAALLLEKVPETGAIDLVDLATALVSEVGAPDASDPTGENATSDQVHELIAHGVLREIVADSRGDDEPQILLSDHPQAPAMTALRSSLTSVLTPGSPPWTLPSGVDGAAWVAAGARHRVLPLLHHHQAQLDLDDLTRARLRAADRNNQQNVEALGTELHRALDTLTDVGVRAMVIKGMALARQAYGNETVRGYGDLDLLVASNDVARANDALEAAGWTPRSDFPRSDSGWAWQHMLDVTHEKPLYGPDSSIDLHWHPVSARSTFPHFDRLWDRRTEVSVFGTPVPTLSGYDALANSCSHAAKDRWVTLRALADIHQLAAQPTTWARADRPLRADQMISLGLACRTFDTPPAAPTMVAEATERAAPYEAVMTANQNGTENSAGTWFPAQRMLRLIQTSRLAQASLSDFARHVYGTLVPVHFVVDGPPQRHRAIAYALRRRVTDTRERLNRGS